LQRAAAQPGQGAIVQGEAGLQRPAAALPAPAIIQPKLQVGAVDDPLEYEADRVADQVMRMPDPVSAPSQINRKCAACEEEDQKTVRTKSAGSSQAAAEVPGVVHAVIRSPGQPLDTATRAFFEPRFGYDLGSVRLHTDRTAAKSAATVGARAYAVGRDIVFANGEYAPGAAQGCQLLAHELTHILHQQGAAPALRRAADPSAAPAPASPTPAPQSRALNSAERGVASYIFGTSLKLDPITIKESSVMSVGGYYRTTPNTIYVPPGRLYTIPIDTLLHELTHCWQYQHGVNVIVTVFWAIVGKYDYGRKQGLRDAREQGLLDAIAAKKCFTSFNTEQQGDIVRDAFNKWEGPSIPYPWSVFIDQVRAGGSCVWPKSTP
jgi:hypothetical protein